MWYNYKLLSQVFSFTFSSTRVIRSHCSLKVKSDKRVWANSQPWLNPKVTETLIHYSSLLKDSTGLTEKKYLVWICFIYYFLKIFINTRGRILIHFLFFIYWSGSGKINLGLWTVTRKKNNSPLNYFRECVKEVRSNTLYNRASSFICKVGSSHSISMLKRAVSGLLFDVDSFVVKEEKGQTAGAYQIAECPKGIPPFLGQQNNFLKYPKWCMVFKYKITLRIN